jgi:flagellar hook-associated protein FlgK
MTFGELAAGLDAAEHVTASLDSTGRLRINADAGFGFDFSLRLDSAPDRIGSFGGASAVAGGGNGGPFSLTFPSTFTVAVDGGAPQTVTLQALSFQNPAAAKASEVAAAISAQLTGAKASVVGDRVVIQSDTQGPTSSLQLTEGAGGPLATLGLTGGQLLTGSALPVEVSISGGYTGTGNDQLRFVTEGTGQIGVTPGLKVGVYDQAGTKVATLDVGKGYSPGDKLAVAQGVSVSFGPGSLSAAAKHQFALDTLADSDTSDALVALGLNVLFKGSSAADIGVSAQLEADPDLLSAGLTGAAGDGDNLGRLLAIRGAPLAALSGQSLEDFQGYLVSEVGFAARSAQELALSQGSLLQFLDDQRQEISGVSIDEEMIDLVRFQQSFQAASRLITTMNEMTQTLIEMAR